MRWKVLLVRLSERTRAGIVRYTETDINPKWHFKDRVKACMYLESYCSSAIRAIEKELSQSAAVHSYH
jgi:hypothetical protein